MSGCISQNESGCVTQNESGCVTHNDDPENDVQGSSNHVGGDKNESRCVRYDDNKNKEGIDLNYISGTQESATSVTVVDTSLRTAVKQGREIEQGAGRSKVSVP